MKKCQIFLSVNFHFMVVKFSIYLNRRVFLMVCRDERVMQPDSDNHYSSIL